MERSMADSNPPLADSDSLAKPRQDQVSPAADAKTTPQSPEHGGPKGLEPTRYGDWERNGRCSDF